MSMYVCLCSVSIDKRLFRTHLPLSTSQQIHVSVLCPPVSERDSSKVLHSQLLSRDTHNGDIVAVAVWMPLESVERSHRASTYAYVGMSCRRRTNMSLCCSLKRMTLIVLPISYLISPTLTYVQQLSTTNLLRHTCPLNKLHPCLQTTHPR